MASIIRDHGFQNPDLERGKRHDPSQYPHPPKKRGSMLGVFSTQAPQNQRRNTNMRSLSFMAPADQDGHGEHLFDGDLFQPHKLKHDVQTNLETIISSLCCHKSFPVKEGYEIKDLPKFDDLTAYGVDATTELGLWEFEVRRLAGAAVSTSPPHLEGKSHWFGQYADTQGYNQLHLLIKQFRYALDICKHDNEHILMEHYPKLVNPKLYELARWSINRVYDDKTGTIRFGQTIRIEENNDEAFHALVNYITAVLVRILTRSLTGTYWINNTITTLARFAAKLKVLTSDLCKAFGRAVEQRRELQNRLVMAQEERDRSHLAFQSVVNSQNEAFANQQKVMQEDGTPAGGLYFIQKALLSHSFSGLLESASFDLHTNNEFRRRSNEFESCSIIYRAGLQNKRYHLCQERDGAIGAAGDPRLVSLAGVAFQVASEIWDTLPDHREYPTATDVTTLTWNRTKRNDSRTPPEDVAVNSKSWTVEPERTRRLINMKEVTQALVPCVLYCGGFSSTLALFAKTLMLTQDSPAPVKYFKQNQITAFAKLTTSAYEEVKPSTPLNAGWSETSHDSRAENGKTNADSNATSVAQTVADTPMATHARQGTVYEDFEEALKQAGSWTLDEKTITIKHKWYSNASLACCTILVAGGVALIAMQDIAKGVDPSNLTALAWAAAGFVMVFLKSRKVQDWPWRDFIQGRIVCRSVTEVEAVTGMEPQKLIAILLHLDAKTPLETRGPYNELFLGKANDGFAIDVPLRTETVISVGFILVRVDNASGPALVAVEPRGKGDYDLMSPKDDKKKGEGKICTNLQEPISYKDEHHRRGLPIYPLSDDELDWLAIQGVFTGNAYFG